VVGLDVRLEDGFDRRTGPLGSLQVLVDQFDVRIDNCERGV
jgi:hypothetical protein